MFNFVLSWVEKEWRQGILFTKDEHLKSKENGCVEYL